MTGSSAKMARSVAGVTLPYAAMHSSKLHQGELMRNGAITASTRLCAVIGNPVGHSLSPSLHNAAFDELGLDYVYVAFRVEDLKSALAGMRALENFRGMSVTIPHKIEAMNLVDEIGEVDRAIGSINTVINDNGRLTGLGTDGPGALKALVDAGVEIDGKSILMLGAGGAARAIAFTLARNTGLRKLALMDINESMLQGLTADLRTGTGSCIESAVLTGDSLARAMEQADIIVNCTPIGMHPRADAYSSPPGCSGRGRWSSISSTTPLKRDCWPMPGPAGSR